MPNERTQDDDNCIAGLLVALPFALILWVLAGIGLSLALRLFD